MSILLEPIDEVLEGTVQAEDWVEIDLLSWSSNDSEFPCGLTLIRHLNDRHQEPYLHNLMFASLHQNKTIKKLTLEIPCSPHSDQLKVFVLKDAMVDSYAIYPPHQQHKRPYEKVVIKAKEKREQDQIKDSHE